MEDPRKYQPVNLISITDTIIEQILLEDMSKHMEEREMIKYSQLAFTKGKCCLTNLVPFNGGVIAEWSREELCMSST